MRHLCIFLLIGWFFPGYGQNLIPNPSFEHYDSCIGPLGAIKPGPGVITGWLSTNAATPDWFSANCRSAPSNEFGYTYAQKGDCYIGMINSGGYRENIQARLLRPLTPGNRYYASYYVKRARRYYSICYGIDRIGISFSMNRVLNPSTNFISTGPAEHTPANVFFTDTLNWVKVTHEFTVASPYEYFLLGVFMNDNNINSLTRTGVLNTIVGTYMYYDNVVLMDLDSAMEFTNTNIRTCHDTTLTAQGRNGNFTYKWSDGDTTQDKILNGVGTYWVKSIDYDSGVIFIDTFSIINTATDIVLDLKDVEICKGDSIQVTVETHPDIRNLIWSTGENSYSIWLKEEENYAVQAITQCDTFHKSFSLKYRQPVLQLTDIDTTFCWNNIRLSLRLNQDQYRWYYDEKLYVQWVLDIKEEGKHSLKVVDTVCNTESSNTITIRTKVCEDCIRMPNAFTPNMDGMNDILLPHFYCDIQNYELKIFNRFGELVFETSSPQTGWDGTYKGSKCDLGVYFYQVSGKYGPGEHEKIFYTGDITLLR